MPIINYATHKARPANPEEVANLSKRFKVLKRVSPFSDWQNWPIVMQKNLMTTMKQQDRMNMMSFLIGNGCQPDKAAYIVLSAGADKAAVAQVNAIAKNYRQYDYQYWDMASRNYQRLNNQLVRGGVPIVHNTGQYRDYTPKPPPRRGDVSADFLARRREREEEIEAEALFEAADEAYDEYMNSKLNKRVRLSQSQDHGLFSLGSAPDYIPDADFNLEDELH